MEDRFFIKAIELLYIIGGFSIAIRRECVFSDSPNEDEFHRVMMFCLNLYQSNDTDIRREPKSNSSRMDISFGGVPVELKLSRVSGLKVDQVNTHQAWQYSQIQSSKIAFHCVLDCQADAVLAGRPEDDIGITIAEEGTPIVVQIFRNRFRPPSGASKSRKK